MAVTTRKAQIAQLLADEGFTYRIHGYEIIALSRRGGLYISLLKAWKLAIVKVYSWSSLSLRNTVENVRSILKAEGFKVEVYH